MESGPELDALIHEKVFGHIIKKAPLSQNQFEMSSPNKPFPKYSTDIKAAFEVVEHLNKAKDFWTELKQIRPANRPDKVEWVCDIYTGNLKKILSSIIIDTPSHAICLAALEALSAEP